jgi:GT2 family glycosyltransferase/glycosyltransferase involved in cell wall biosynthesis
LGENGPHGGAWAGDLRTLLIILWRLVKALPLVLVFPILLLIAIAALALVDFASLFRTKKLPPEQRPRTKSASVVIPNWNGRDLLDKYLPSVIDALGDSPDNEIIVVDNGSEDGSAEFLRERFPSVRVLALDRNLGFGGGSNAGFRAANNDIVVLLNSDMRVERDFLGPLLETFTDETVFSVACQIFFSDPSKLREETGLTQSWWENGSLRVRHRDDPAIQVPYPCAYGGGGSCAFDRRKFLDLGGFDELLAPFYMEDTDVGYLAWKRGWKVLYQPRSVVYHEHRGTIGKRFSAGEIDLVLKKNFALFSWKNIHEWRRLESHFFFAYAGAVVTVLFGDSLERANFAGLWRAFRQLPGAMRSRAMARQLAVINDTEAFRRPLGGYFRDRFVPLGPLADARGSERLSVLFISPYPICPPVHGGGVFMYQTALELTRLCDLHLLILLDYAWQREPHQELERKVSSVEYLVRTEGTEKQFGSILPHAVREFASQEFEWRLHREMYLREIDVVQLEYTALSQYGGAYRQLGCVLFEHDIYFQSIARGLAGMRGFLDTAKASYEYLRALRYELRVLPRFDRVQVCSPNNGDYLLSFLPRLRGRIDDNRAGIATSRYEFRAEGREPETMLFLGSFRHLPNQEGLNWFAQKVLPRVLERKPGARLIIVGSEPPAAHSLPHLPENIELRGFVEDVREPLGRYAVFVCPILSGSGMRVKLLEAFAAGIPVVSTPLGAEGLAGADGEICSLAAGPLEFAQKIVELFEDGEKARGLACRARERVVATRDMRVLTERLVESYREVLREKRAENRLSHRYTQMNTD